MSILVGIITILAAVVAFLFHSLQGAETDAQLAETKGKDSELKATQNEIKAAIASLDEGINKAKAQKAADDKKVADDNMSLAERADRLRKGIQ